MRCLYLLRYDTRPLCYHKNVNVKFCLQNHVKTFPFRKIRGMDPDVNKDLSQIDLFTCVLENRVRKYLFQIAYYVIKVTKERKYNVILL